MQPPGKPAQEEKAAEGGALGTPRCMVLAQRFAGQWPGRRQLAGKEVLPFLGEPTYRLFYLFSTLSPACWTPRRETLQQPCLFVFQQLPACGGAHAGAWPRCGSLLPALRVQVRGTEHHHHQGTAGVWGLHRCALSHVFC